LFTLKALGMLGVKYEINKDNVIIHGVSGIKGFQQPKDDLYLGNSGTGARLLTGLLAGCEGLNVRVTGDKFLSKRPMKRIIEPLIKMGADIKAKDNKFLPIEVTGKKLKGIEYVLPMASAQVKSCVLLAGLAATGQTEVIEPEHSRNHTENMFKYLDVDIKTVDKKIVLRPQENQIKSKDFFIPGDISSASFFIVLGVLCSNDGILIKNVGLNSTRRGIISVLKSMGAFIEIKNEKNLSGEVVGDIFVKKSELKGIEIQGEIIPNIIDEIPIISLAAIFAKGQTIIKDAIELRYKECDRIAAIKNEFCKLGADIKELENGLIIEGNSGNIQDLKGAKVSSHYDHRIAMSEIIIGLIINGKTEIDDIACIDTSFPLFFECLNQVGIKL